MMLVHAGMNGHEGISEHSIFVDVDTTDHQAVERARRLALENGASLSIVGAVDEALWWADAVLSGLPKRWQAKFVEDANVKLQQIAEPLQAAGINVTCKTLVGRVWMELIREVLRSKHDLLVKDVDSSSKGATGISSGMDLHVLRKCPCPVWLVKRKVKRFRRISCRNRCCTGRRTSKCLQREDHAARMRNRRI